MKKITLELTKREAEIAKLFFTNQQEGCKDNIHTAFPTIHVVESPEALPAAEDLGDEERYVIFGGGDTYVFHTFKEAIEAVKEEHDLDKEITENDFDCEDKIHLSEYCSDFDEEDLIVLMPVHIVFHPVAFFMVRLEAERYMQYQSHNLPKGTRIYTYYAPGHGGEGDMIQVASILTKIGKEV